MFCFPPPLLHATCSSLNHPLPPWILSFTRPPHQKKNNSFLPIPTCSKSVYLSYCCLLSLISSCCCCCCSPAETNKYGQTLTLLPLSNLISTYSSCFFSPHTFDFCWHVWPSDSVNIATGRLHVPSVHPPTIPTCQQNVF